jgi:uncharacterized protein (DUF433 family)
MAFFLKHSRSGRLKPTHNRAFESDAVQRCALHGAAQRERYCLNAGGELELANRGTNMSNTAPVIHSDPDILGGTPVFVGTRVPFRNLIDYLERNHSLDEFLDSFPSVSREQAVASLEAAHEALSARAHSA